MEQEIKFYRLHSSLSKDEDFYDFEAGSIEQAIGICFEICKEDGYNFNNSFLEIIMANNITEEERIVVDAYNNKRTKELLGIK